MVGRPPDVRALTEHLKCALAVLELQSAGARRSRVTNYALRKLRRTSKERTKQEPSEFERRHHKTTSTAYVERLKASEIAVSLKGCPAPANA